jgi:adenosylmethionine-8-amino-7-oxononanoate aminotransferase
VPPLIITERQIDLVLDIVARAAHNVLHEAAACVPCHP